MNLTTLASDAAVAASAFRDLSDPQLAQLAAPDSPAWVRFDRDRLLVGLADRRWVSCPLWWFPRLDHADSNGRGHLELSPMGIHWPLPDEDISVEGLLAGRGDLTIGSGLRSQFLEAQAPVIEAVTHDDNTVCLALSDGRCLGIPLAYCTETSIDSPA